MTTKARKEGTVDRDYKPVDCNLCGSDAYQTRYKLDVSSIVTCEHCQLSYVNPRVSSAWLRHKLDEWAKTDTVDQERLRIAFDEGTMDLYSRFLAWINTALDEPRDSPKLLDIGCSVGSFLTMARSQSYDVQGLEIGEASAAYARSEHRLDVRDGSVYDCDFENGSFDVISMLEVIEHLEDPKEAVRRVSNWVAPGGVLFLTTPNFNSLYRRLYGSNWWVVNCEDEHIYFFTISSLTSLIEECGFDVKFVATRGFDIAGMLKQLFRPRAATDSDAQQTDVLDYYETRSSKEKIKGFLGRIGALQLVRSLLRALDWLASQRWSPLYGLGEQLIIIGTRRK